MIGFEIPVHGRRVESENEELPIRFANMSRSKLFQPNYDCILEVFERSTNGTKWA